MRDVILTTILLLLFFAGAAWLDDAEANECYDFASFVEVAAESDGDHQARQFEAWKHLASYDRAKLAIIHRAEAFVKAGGTADAAWRQCPGV